MLTPGEILDWTPEEIRTWLRIRPSEGSFNWLTLGEGAAMAATSGDGVEPAKRDALGELAVYAFQMAQRHDEGVRAGATLSELILRAGLIQRLGSAPHGVRDEAALRDLLCEQVATADGVKERVSEGPIDLMSAPQADLRTLRHVKNVLRATESFLAGAVDLPESLSWWWSRRDRLP
jgi:hypothetical protein